MLTSDYTACPHPVLCCVSLDTANLFLLGLQGPKYLDVCDMKSSLHSGWGAGGLKSLIWGSWKAKGVDWAWGVVKNRDRKLSPRELGKATGVSVHHLSARGPVFDRL